MVLASAIEQQKARIATASVTPLRLLPIRLPPRADLLALRWSVAQACSSRLLAIPRKATGRSTRVGMTESHFPCPASPAIGQPRDWYERQGPIQEASGAWQRRSVHEGGLWLRRRPSRIRRMTPRRVVSLPERCMGRTPRVSLSGGCGQLRARATEYSIRLRLSSVRFMTRSSPRKNAAFRPLVLRPSEERPARALQKRARGCGRAFSRPERTDPPRNRSILAQVR